MKQSHNDVLMMIGKSVRQMLAPHFSGQKFRRINKRTYTIGAVFLQNGADR